MVIKIFAGDGEGKSTIAEWLMVELEKLGVQVTNEDEDKPSIPLKERLKIMTTQADPLNVTIKTIPSRVESTPEYAKRFKSQS